ncbi:efflux RND transporter periplasmic adaptor subunit [Candidatus Epulonipiscium viviparus]|uniref:efflux RND transporter periplasmic adaptor subunit n=1 Tax=Candidatus Epulonipiscium viviparus TaxID=420336 RepID=UPI0027380602|nr:efflux RND transporter periplasmic adaptor subunit [Candidatus Epulopiscium viviparus]
MKILQKAMAVFLVASILSGCSMASANAETEVEEPIAAPEEELKLSVHTVKAVRGALAQSGEFVGTLMPSEVANIISPVMGFVENIYVEDGDYVTSGQLLYTIDDDNVVAQIDSAMVALESSQKSKEQALFNARNAVTNQEMSKETLLLNREQTLYNAENTIKNAEIALSQLELGYIQALEQADTQIKNANLQYDSAVAGYELQFGTADDISNMNTNKQIEDLEKTIEDTRDQIEDAEEAAEDIKEAQEDLEELLDVMEDQMDDQYALLNSGTLSPEMYAQVDASIQATRTEIFKQEQTLDTLETNYENALEAIDDIRDTVVDLEENLAFQKEVVNLQNTNLKGEQVKAQSLSITQAENAIAQAEDGRRKTIESYEMQIKQARDSVQAAKDAAEFTRRSLENQISQTDTGLKTSRDTLNITAQMSDMQIKNAQTTINNAKIQLDQYTVESPISGIIENITIIEDSITTSSAASATVSDYKTMEVLFYVGTDLKNSMKIGQEVNFELESKVYQAYISEISDNADPQNKLFKITATFNPATRLENGAAVRLTTGTFSENQTIIIPYDCLVFSNGLAYVYKVVNNRAVKVPVEIGLYTATSVSILSGLAAGDEVVTTWSEGLRDGVLLDTNT